MYNIDLANVKSIVADIVAKHNVENVAFVGCGASKAELYPAKYFLANCSKKLRVAHYTANEFNYDTPDWLGDTTVVITASLGGSTPETVKANSVAKAAGARVVGTGRSDFPNQINNVVAFPGIFKGALEGRATQITEEMKLAAAEALAGLVSDEELNDDFIMPEAFDPRVAAVVSEAVKTHI